MTSHVTIRPCTLLALGAALALAGCAGAPLQVQALEPSTPSGPVTVTPGPGGFITMENDTIKLVVDTEQGGSISSFIHKPLGKDVVPAERGKDNMGLMLDHCWGIGPWPGEMMLAGYEVVKVQSGADRGWVRMRHTLKGTFKGKSDPRARGLVFEKTLTLRADTDALFCRVSFRNPTDQAKMVSYWVQNYYHPAGDYDAENDISARPTATGIFRKGRVRGKDFVWDMTRGWSAMTDTAKRRGLVWLMDYNYLNSLYNYDNTMTLEWVYDRVLIPPGKAWETEVVMLPFSDVRDISFASRNLIAGLNIARDEDRNIRLTHSLRQGTHPAEEVRLRVEVISAGGGGKAEFVLNPGRLDVSTRVLRQEIADDLNDPLIVKVTASGKSAGRRFEESYWDFYAGTYGYGGNVQMDMVTPLYLEKRPEKRPVLLKPDVIRRIPGKRHYFTMKGTFSEYLRLEEAFRLAGQEAPRDGLPTVGVYTYSGYGMGAQISVFPFDYDQLMRYAALVAANVDMDCLGVIGKEMLRDYVLHGGGLLVLGGRGAYAGGGWKKSKLEDLLPFELKQGECDLERTDGATLRLGEAHAITRGIDLDSAPRVDYLHHIAGLKKGARILLRAGDRPFLVVRETGEGRVACILAAPYGPVQGQYFAWPEWPRLLKNVLIWLERGTD